jgi:hypothetical protein
MRWRSKLLKPNVLLLDEPAILDVKSMDWQGIIWDLFGKHDYGFAYVISDRMVDSIVATWGKLPSIRITPLSQ